MVLIFNNISGCTTQIKVRWCEPGILNVGTSSVNLSSLQRHIVVDTFFGYDEESMDSETSSVASFRMDRTPATPDEDLDQVRAPPCGRHRECVLHHLWLWVLLYHPAASPASKAVCLWVCFRTGSSQWGVGAAFPPADQGVPGLTASLRPAAGTEGRHTGCWDGSQGTNTAQSSYTKKTLVT